jgi:hypothetical protein
MIDNTIHIDHYSGVRFYFWNNISLWTLKLYQETGCACHVLFGLTWIQFTITPVVSTPSFAELGSRLFICGREFFEPGPGGGMTTLPAVEGHSGQANGHLIAGLGSGLSFCGLVAKPCLFPWLSGSLLKNIWLKTFLYWGSSICGLGALFIGFPRRAFIFTIFRAVSDWRSFTRLHRNTEH